MTQDVPSFDCWQADLIAKILPALLERGIGLDVELINRTGLEFRYAGRTVRITIEEQDPTPSDSWPVFDQKPGRAIPQSPAPVPSEEVDRGLAAMAKGFRVPEDVVDPHD